MRGELDRSTGAMGCESAAFSRAAFVWVVCRGRKTRRREQEPTEQYGADLFHADLIHDGFGSKRAPGDGDRAAYSFRVRERKARHELAREFGDAAFARR